MEPFVKLPVRQLVEFVLKGGSIDNRFGGADRALEAAASTAAFKKKKGKTTRRRCAFLTAVLMRERPL